MNKRGQTIAISLSDFFAIFPLMLVLITALIIVQPSNEASVKYTESREYGLDPLLFSHFISQLAPDKKTAAQGFEAVLVSQAAPERSTVESLIKSASTNPFTGIGKVHSLMWFGQNKQINCYLMKYYSSCEEGTFKDRNGLHQFHRALSSADLQVVGVHAYLLAGNSLQPLTLVPPERYEETVNG